MRSIKSSLMNLGFLITSTIALLNAQQLTFSVPDLLKSIADTNGERFTTVKRKALEEYSFLRPPKTLSGRCWDGTCRCSPQELRDFLLTASREQRLFINVEAIIHALCQTSSETELRDDAAETCSICCESSDYPCFILHPCGHPIHRHCLRRYCYTGYPELKCISPCCRIPLSKRMMKWIIGKPYWKRTRKLKRMGRRLFREARQKQLEEDRIMAERLQAEFDLEARFYQDYEDDDAQARHGLW